MSTKSKAKKRQEEKQKEKEKEMSPSEKKVKKFIGDMIEAVRIAGFPLRPNLERNLSALDNRPCKDIDSGIAAHPKLGT